MQHRGKRPNGLVALYRTLWRYAAGERRRLVTFMALLIGAQVMKLAIPVFTGHAVTAVQRSDLAEAARDMGWIFAATLAAWALHAPGRMIERLVAIGVRQRHADALYGKAVALPLAWHERNHSGGTIRRIDKSGTALYGFAENQYLYLQNFVCLVGPIVAIFLISVPTGAAALAGYALIAIVLVRFDRVMIRLNRVQNRAERRYSATLVDGLGNIGTLLTLRLGDAVRSRLAVRLGAVFAPLRRNIALNEAKWFATDILNNGIRCGLAVLYVWLAWRDGDTLVLGSAVMVFQYAQQAGSVVSNMAACYQDLITWQTDLGSADPLIEASAAVAHSSAPPADWREIHVEGLRFAYDGADGHGLETASLRLRRGGRIALVGNSGAGKTTLLRMLAGLYAPQHGRFAVDGRIDPELRHLGAAATLVPQDPEIFAGTIGYNITLGVDHGPNEIARACDLAGLTSVLERLRCGLDTDIAERGLNLSGGQKQRLALARGILAARGSSLLLLDEPTSSLDARTEARVYDNLLASFPDACILSAVHRLHLLPRFDEILFLADGRIVECGPLDELVERVPSFRAMIESYGKLGRSAAMAA